jgi:hypothetical protein
MIKNAHVFTDRQAKQVVVVEAEKAVGREEEVG